MRALRMTVVSMLVLGCGPRSLWSRLDQPGKYEAIKQAEAEHAALLESQKAKDRQPGDAKAASTFAARLAAASKRFGALDVLTEAGDSIDREALLASAVTGLQTAAAAHPDQAGALHLRRAKLLVAVDKRASAVSAIQDSLAARPTFAALRTLEEIGSTRPSAEQLRPACDALHGQLVLPEDVMGDRGRQEAVIFDVVTFLDACGGIRRVIIEDSGTRYAFADWVSPKEQQSYLRVKGAVAEVRAEEQARIQAHFREGCIDQCERLYKVCKNPDVSCERDRRACIEGC